MSFEIIRVDPDQTALFLTLKIQVRITNRWGLDIRGGVVEAQVFYSDKGKRQFIGNEHFSFGAVLNAQTIDSSLRFSLAPEAVHLIEEARSPDGDVPLDFFFSGLYFRTDAVNVSPFTSSEASTRISMSDWVKISQPWGKDIALVVLLPKSKEKLDELKKVLRYSDLDEVIDEAYIQLKGRKVTSQQQSKPPEPN